MASPLTCVSSARYWPDPSPVPCYGIAAVQTYMREFLADWRDLRLEADRFREADGSISVDVRVAGIDRHSGT